MKQSASVKSNVTNDLKNAFEPTGQTQLSVMQVPGADISKYRVIIRGDTPGAVAGIVEKPRFDETPSDSAWIGRYILTQDIFDELQDLPAGGGAEIQLAEAINIQAQRSNLNAVHSTALRFDCGSVDGSSAAISHVSNLRHI
jgi:UTP--glucose-1-phosphate uridylyltransferase